MKIFTISNLKEFRKTKISVRSEGLINEKMEYVREIINDVKVNKDEALIKYTKKFDGILLSKETIEVTKDEIQQALNMVEEDFKQAIRYARDNVEKYHTKQKPVEFEVEVQQGIRLGRRWEPIETVGLYIPGGKAPYVTACYMLGTPAKIAGCKNIVACVPPDKETGTINPYILVSAYYSGITRIFKVGGAQAIAAMAYGTEVIPKVGKIFGPGNVYVTCAKLSVYGNVDIDSPAGPSEALIIADDSIPVRFVASDIISQAEHDVNSAAVFITISEEFAKQVKEEVYKQIKELKRKETIEKSLENFGAIVVCEDIQTCIDIANEYAPEHIQIMTQNSLEVSKKIVNSGSICIGRYSAIAMGDYVSGVNNVILTGGAAKSFSPVHVEGFMKSIQTQQISKDGLKNAEKYVRIISEIEGFDAHYNSVKLRLEDNNM